MKMDEKRDLFSTRMMPAKDPSVLTLQLHFLSETVEESRAYPEQEHRNTTKDKSTRKTDETWVLIEDTKAPPKEKVLTFAHTHLFLVSFLLFSSSSKPCLLF